METRKMPRDPRTVGIACAITATGLGVAYLSAAGAPPIYLTINALALVMGLTIFGIVQRSGQAPRVPNLAILALGASLLVTALFGASVDGASRWIRLGGLSLQASLVVMPVMLVAYARRRDLSSTLGVILAAVALALQPDRAMAGVLAAAMTVLALHVRHRWVVSGMVAAVAAFAVTLVRPDRLSPAPYVEQVLYTAFEVHSLAGMAVVGGAVLLVVPAILGTAVDPQNGAVYQVFGIIWLGTVVAAALGNYPTPVVGYGGSSVLGYAMSLSFLPRNVRSAPAADVRWSHADPVDGDRDVDLRTRLAY